MTSLRAASAASALNFPCSPRLASGSLCPLQGRSRETRRSCSISCRGSLRPMRLVTQSCPCLLRSVCPLLQARTCLGPSVFLISLGIWGSVNVSVALPPGASLVGFRTPAETARSRTAYPRPLILNTRRVTPSPHLPAARGRFAPPQGLPGSFPGFGAGLAYRSTVLRPTNPGAVWVWGLERGAWKLKG